MSGLKVIVRPQIAIATNALSEADHSADSGWSEQTRKDLLVAKKAIQTALDFINGKPPKKRRSVSL